MSRFACGAAWLLCAGTCLCTTACGLLNNDDLPTIDSVAGTASEPAHAGSAGAANSVGGGDNVGGSSLNTGGTTISLVLGGSPPEIDTEPPVEPHPGVPCDNPQPFPGGGGYLVCENKSLRRGEPSACPNTLPRDMPTLPLFLDECGLDTDCTASPYGHCELGQCKYGCISDDDCGEQQICFCGVDIGHCVSAACTSDAECPADYPCTGNLPFGYESPSFRCQSPFDECQSSYDCPGTRSHCGSDGTHRYCWTDTVG